MPVLVIYPKSKPLKRHHIKPRVVAQFGTNPREIVHRRGRYEIAYETLYDAVSQSVKDGRASVMVAGVACYMETKASITTPRRPRSRCPRRSRPDTPVMEESWREVFYVDEGPWGVPIDNDPGPSEILRWSDVTPDIVPRDYSDWWYDYYRGFD